VRELPERAGSAFVMMAGRVVAFFIVDFVYC